MGPGRGRERGKEMGGKGREGREGGDRKRKEGKGREERGNGSMHPLGFSKVGACLKF